MYKYMVYPSDKPVDNVNNHIDPKSEPLKYAPLHS